MPVKAAAAALLCETCETVLAQGQPGRFAYDLHRLCKCEVKKDKSQKWMDAARTAYIPQLHETTQLRA